MEIAESIVGRLRDMGGLLPDGAVEEVKRIISPGFVPSGNRIKWEDLSNWSKSPPGCRCCLRTGEDVQSLGSFFCGKPAVAMAKSQDKTNEGLCIFVKGIQEVNAFLMK